MPIKILAEVNHGMEEWRTTVLESRATVDYLFLKHSLGRQQFLGLCCFSVSDLSHTTDGQTDNLHKLRNKMSQVNFE